MQKNIYRFLTLFTVALLMAIAGAQAQSTKTTSENVSLADSLFKIKRYTEALEVYQKVLKAGQYTPQMLLKMAYVKEALGDATLTLYYLSLYYHYTSDATVLSKMEEVAEAEKLSGYTFDDQEYFISRVRKYLHWIQAFFSILAIGGFLLLLRARTKGESIISASIGYSFMLIVLLALFNLKTTLDLFGMDYGIERAIIRESNTLLMEAPSAGSRQIQVLEEGHRVDIINKSDIWLKIRMDERIGYVRSHNLLLVK